MSLTIPDEVLRSAEMTAHELTVEIAVMLYARGRLSMEQAMRLAGMPRIEFQQLLANRDIPMNYTMEDFEQDLQTLRTLRGL